MKNLEFHNPVKIIFGAGVIRQVGQTLQRDFDKVMVLVAKGALATNGCYSGLVDDLSRHGIGVVEMEPIDSNPRLMSVRSGAKLCREKGVQGIVALGGGSTMDCAKVIAAAAAMDVDPARFIWGDCVSITKSLPTVMIPTIAATGTEVNNTAVIRDEQRKLKNSCASDSMFARYAFMDPELAETLPVKLGLWGGFDILSHTFEYYFNGDESVFQNRFSEGILLAVMELLERYAAQGYTAQMYGELMWSALMTWGTGLTRIGRGLPDMACHTIEEGIGARLDTHHGAGLSVLTPLWMKAVYKEKPKIFARFARNVMGVGEKEDMACAQKGVELFCHWVRELGLPQSYKDLTGAPIDAQEVKSIAKSVFEQNGGAVGRLVPLDEKAVEALLRKSCGL